MEEGRADRQQGRQDGGDEGAAAAGASAAPPPPPLHPCCSRLRGRRGRAMRGPSRRRGHCGKERTGDPVVWHCKDSLAGAGVVPACCHRLTHTAGDCWQLLTSAAGSGGAGAAAPKKQHDAASAGVGCLSQCCSGPACARRESPSNPRQAPARVLRQFPPMSFLSRAAARGLTLGSRRGLVTDAAVRRAAAATPALHVPAVPPLPARLSPLALPSLPPARPLPAGSPR